MSEKGSEFSAAVAQLLSAAGLDTADPDLVDTPRRVDELWHEEILSGYRMDPQEILGRTIADESATEMVLLCDLSFHSMCPHHLLPSQGKATVAFLPAGRLVGLGQLARLVACFTQRLVLQEHAGDQIAAALMALPARGAACVLEARHMCLSIKGDRHDDATVVTSAFLGEFATRPDLQQRVLGGRVAAPRLGR